MPSYALSAQLPLPLTEAEPLVRAALQKEQFGIISEVDIRAKLQEKLGVDHPPHKILGSCNPNIAYQALQDNADVALALPCNVVLEEREGRTIITALLPSIALQPFEGQGVRECARTAEAALKRVFAALVSASHP